MRFSILFVTLLFAGSQAFAQATLNDKREKLDKTKKKIQEQKQKLESLKGKEESILKNLGQIDQKKATLHDQKNVLEKNIKSIDTEITTTNQSIGDRQIRINERKSSIKQQLRNLYMYGEMNYLKVFLASTTFDDLNQKQFLVKQWVEHDRRRMIDFKDDADRLTLEKQTLEEKKDAKKKNMNTLETTEKQIQKEQASKKKLLSMVKTQKDYYQKSIQELEQASKNLEILIHQFRKKGSVPDSPTSTSRFGQMRGRLLMPVAGVIEKKYGPYQDARLHVNLYQKGVDIRAKRGAEVSAVFDGKVVYADWFAGYGKVVILDHDAGYFTLYAHLSEIQVAINQLVTIGDDLGKVGDTESLKGDYLYFELREKGVTVNPLPWFDR